MEKTEVDDPLVPLTESTGMYRRSAIESVLRDAGIPYIVQDSSAPIGVLGRDAPLVSQRFQVPRSRLQEAKDLLCANGIVCDVSERLLRRALEEIVKPLLGATGDRDLSRLEHFLHVNNRETIRALLDRTLALEGGPDLLEDAFFRLTGTGSLAALRILARGLAPFAGDRFFARMGKVMEKGLPEAQVDLLEVLREFPSEGIRRRILLLALESTETEVLEAADEALASMGWRVADVMRDDPFSGAGP